MGKKLSLTPDEEKYNKPMYSKVNSLGHVQHVVPLRRTRSRAVQIVRTNYTQLWSLRIGTVLQSQ